jgi:putative SOS response-associated peptidase YedK
MLGRGVEHNCRPAASPHWSNTIVCGRFTLVSNISELQGRFGFLSEYTSLEPRYNIAPTDQVLTVTNDGYRKGEMMRWGLVPSWAKDLKVGSRMINAVSETAAAKPAFRTAFRKRRCLVLASGFYEWKKDGKTRIPQYIFLKSGEPMAFAGLWELWKSPAGEWVRSCSILTTAANSFIEPVHNRMPVILSAETEALWLDPVTGDPETLQRLLIPAPPESLDFYAVSGEVNNVGNKGPECLAPAFPAAAAAQIEARLFS